MKQFLTLLSLALLLLGGCKLENLHDDSEVAPAPSCDNLTADFSIANSPCIWPCEIVFENNSVNGLSYLWDFGEGTTSILSDPTQSYAKPGTYTVKLIARDENGCEKTTRKDAVIEYLTYEKTFGEEASSENAAQLIACADGGFAIIGTNDDFGTRGSEAYILRVDFEGTELWDQSYGGLANDQAFSGIETPDGGFVLVGQSQNPDTIENEKAYLARIFSDGNLWFDNFYEDAKRNSSPDFIYTSKFSSVIQASNGRYIMLGTSNGFFQFGGGGSAKVFVGEQTDRSFDFQGAVYSQSDFNEGIEVIETSNGPGYILLGTTQLPNETESDVYLIKTDTSGQMLWDKVLVDVNSFSPVSIIETTDQGFIIAGLKNSLISVLKVDASGNFVWEKSYAGTGNEAVASFIQNEEGDLILLGSQGQGNNADLYLLKLSSNGDFIWERTFGGALAERGIDILPAADGGYVIVGEKAQELNNTNADILLIKTDDQGNVK